MALKKYLQQRYTVKEMEYYKFAPQNFMCEAFNGYLRKWLPKSTNFQEGYDARESCAKASWNEGITRKCIATYQRKTTVSTTNNTIRRRTQLVRKLERPSYRWKEAIRALVFGVDKS